MKTEHKYKIEMEISVRDKLNLKEVDIEDLLMDIYDTDEHNLFWGFIDDEKIKEL